MHLALQLLVLAHLVGFAALLGGVLVQVREPDPEVSTTMVVGGWVGLATGVALVVLELAGGVRVAWWPVSVKLVLALFLVLLLVRNRRFLSVPRGLWALVGVLTLLEAAVALLWPAPTGQ